MREFLPWHELEQKLAMRANLGLEANADDEAGADEEGLRKPTDSGVRVSEHVRAVPPPAEDEAALSFKVYTLEDLERRAADSDAPPSIIRFSREGIAPTKAPSPWREVAMAGRAVMGAFLGWTRLGKGKPPLADVVRAPAQVFRAELRQATKTISWRRAGWWALASIVMGVVLLFAVVTVAELTDDLKPVRSDGEVSRTSIVPSTADPTAGDEHTLGAIAQPYPAVAPMVQSTTTTPAPINGGELDDPPARTTATPTRGHHADPRGAGHAATVKGKAAPLAPSTPNAEVFTP